MQRLFGTKKPAAPDASQACQQLRDTQEVLNKKVQFLEKKIVDETQRARHEGTKNKRAALAALRRKKQYENQLAQLDGTLTTIEMQIDALENTRTNVEVMKALKTANAAMKSKANKVDIDSIHDVMDDVQEQRDLAREMAEAISQPIGNEVDMDELEAELEMLEQEELDRELINVSPPSVGGPIPEIPMSTPVLPAGPTSTANKGASGKNEKELDDLLQWAS